MQVAESASYVGRVDTINNSTIVFENITPTQRKKIIIFEIQNKKLLISFLNSAVDCLGYRSISPFPLIVIQSELGITVLKH